MSVPYGIQGVQVRAVHRWNHGPNTDGKHQTHPHRDLHHRSLQQILHRMFGGLSRIGNTPPAEQLKSMNIPYMMNGKLALRDRRKFRTSVVAVFASSQGRGTVIVSVNFVWSCGRASRAGRCNANAMPSPLAQNDSGRGQGQPCGYLTTLSLVCNLIRLH